MDDEVATASAAPHGTVIYAIGDIHGRIDLLDALLHRIVTDAHSLPGPARLRLAFLGDYVDRGPGSRAVIDRLSRMSALGGAVTCLRGNHEQVLLDFLTDAAVGPDWIRFGGDATLRSYGVTPPRRPDDPRAWEAARRALLSALPEAHLSWLRSLPTMFEAGDYFFVHAGVRPGWSLGQQSERDLLWIREPFLSWSGPHERVIVHGHSPTAAAHLGRWRIGIDTGAYATGRLTALRLVGTERRLIQTAPDCGA